MPLVSAIVVTSGEKEHWRSCLKALSSQTHQSIEVIFVDNSPNSSLAAEIKAEHPDVYYYSEARNMYYAEGLNKGISLSKGEFLLCLNDDTVLSQGFISFALKGFQAGEKVGMVSGKILRPDGKTIDSAGLYLSVFRTAVERGYNSPDTGRFNNQEFVFGVGGAAAFYRRSALDSVKEANEYFSASFRMFYEDLDLAWRLQRNGWKCAYVPQAVGFHIRGASCRNGGLNRRLARKYLSSELHWDLVKNRYLTIARNENLPGFLLHLPFIMFYDLFAWGFMLLTRPETLRKVPSLFRQLTASAA